ncbi:MAG: hypothetical protein P4L82_14455 [Ancalomicrobiaceae bacterium]|nr:hypothetical protein [Ancalomicrobiaceae bacterium]
MIMARRLILDSCLLVLFIVGLTDKHRIKAHKNLKAYDVDDFERLERIVNSHKELVINPNVLAETSSLIRQTDENFCSDVTLTLGKLIGHSEEIYIKSDTAICRTEYDWLGLTDAVLLELAVDDTHLLTVDVKLYLAAAKAGLEVTNYNHIKERFL